MSDANASAVKQRRQRTKTKRQLVLVEVTEDRDTKQQCFAVLPTPSIRPEHLLKKSSVDQIEAACRNAVYDTGNAEYGNKSLAVVSVLSTFTVPYEQRQVLAPPRKKQEVDQDHE